MADNKKVQEEDLKKLEDEAYFELCQIIAEAMELQDVDLLNARIASWKNKYKKLLDRPSTNSKSDFKRRIEFLLTQYYSEVTRYILSQLKLKEEKKVENQAKALRELYTIIRDTNDLDSLKKKVKKWEEKYPVSGFLKMYQKRIQSYTREKNLKENAFEQEQAFYDLLNLTKIHGTLDELKTELTLWEEKYSINNKYTVDDFIKHQTEIKRFTSDEFLQSIARDESTPDNVDKNEIDFVEAYNNKSFSDLAVQASSYAALLKISKSANAVNEMFTWVYKNRDVKFNDKYKELILSATYLEYSPAYLNKISKPEIDMSKSSLSFDEYKNINDIKRYAIISYFNLLLPPEKAIANDYFNKHIQTIYAKSEKARISDVKDEAPPLTDIANSGIEISLKEPRTVSYVLEVDSDTTKLESDQVVENSESMQPEIINSSDTVIVPEDNSETVIGLSTTELETTIDLTLPVEDKPEEKDVPQLTVPEDDPKTLIDLSTTEPEITVDLALPVEDKPEEKDVLQLTVPEDDPKTLIDLSTTEPETTIDLTLPVEDKPEEKDVPQLTVPEDNSKTVIDLSITEPEITVDLTLPVEDKPEEKDVSQGTVFEDNSEKDLDYTTIVAFSPLFFEAIHNYHKQSVLVGHIDSTVTKYVGTEKSKEATLDQRTKTKIDEE